MKTSFCTALVLLSAASVPLIAQGNLSTQGYGYPQGQLTTRALSLGGSIGEIDISSTVNPASLGRVTNRTILFQIEPELRTLTAGTATNHTITARYPLVSIAVPFGGNLVTGVSASTLLDRSWATTTTRTQLVGTEQIVSTANESSNGAMNDLRLAETWTNRTWLSIGLGVHAITGRNVVRSSESFDDSSFSTFASTRQISYTGSALSAGVQISSLATKTILGLSYRMGNSLKAVTNDTALARGQAPDHFGASLAYTGIQGTVLAVRAARDGWSSMTPMLSKAGEEAHDAWDLGAGAEITGPHLLGQPMQVRLGGRTRKLPFEAEGNVVSEKSLSLGSGFNFGGGRMSADFAASRQWRDANITNVKERAWTLSLSLTARP